MPSRRKHVDSDLNGQLRFAKKPASIDVARKPAGWNPSNAAPWPTGVSHEVRVQTIRATPDVTKTVPLLMMQIRRPLNRAGYRMLRGPS
jgi:hypothetical protein